MFCKEKIADNFCINDIERIIAKHSLLMTNNVLEPGIFARPKTY